MAQQWALSSVPDTAASILASPHVHINAAAALPTSFSGHSVRYVQCPSFEIPAMYPRLVIQGLARKSACVQFRHLASKAGNKSTVDPSEVAKFAAQAAKWWHPEGSAGPLHRMNPTRVAFIRSAIERHVGAKPEAKHSPKPLAGIDLVDVGCGGGLVTEPFARLGANVLGVDMSQESLEVARYHALQDPSLATSERLRYKQAAVEDLAASSDTFDVVLALEIIEHVAEPTTFLRECASLVREGGLMVISTLNRTVASYALGIIAAERILGWLPPGTHDWNKFPRPEEVAHVIATETDLVPGEVTGVAFNPVTATFAVADDTSVNYILTATRPKTSGMDAKPGNKEAGL